MYYFDKQDYLSFDQGNSKSFALGNGLGGMCSMSIINSTYRKQYGYLVCALNPPLNRKLVLTKTTEKVVMGNKVVDLDCQKYVDHIVDNKKYLFEFSYNYIPTFNYQVDGLSIKKKISPVYNSNTVCISYEFYSSTDTSVIIEPLFNYRDMGDVSSIDDLKFNINLKKNILTLTPMEDKNIHIKMQFDGCSLFFNDLDKQYTDGYYNEYDIKNGDDRIDYQYKPIYLKKDIASHQIDYVSIVVTIDRLPKKDAISLIMEEQERIRQVIRHAKLNDMFANKLVWSSDSFIVKRESTNLKTILAGLPWFGDWGRDTMIAFTGLTLVTRRYKDAKEILKSFSLYMKDGIIPNMFPDEKNEPMYNTADASLWYIYACYKYVKYTGDYEFIKEEIYPYLKQIIDCYKKGTMNDIYMDKDYLIHAGSGLDQVTWMDVRFDNYVVTPRHGKPVEINALWYNALKIMSYFASMWGFDDQYDKLAVEVKKSFRNKFYSPSLGYLYDVVDQNDDKLRPNQLYALSLPFKIFDREETKKILNRVNNELYNIYGIRTLSYKDKEYKPTYEGPLRDRDLAYHMGSTWPYLIGAYFDTFNYAYPEKKVELIKMFKEFEHHLEVDCINGIAEVMNGSGNLDSKGCYNQAWSIGEVLRSYYENIIVGGKDE